MGGSKTYVPYPTFYKTSPLASSTGYLPAVGRCRIYPATCCQNLASNESKDEASNVNDEFEAIASKSVEQSQVGNPSISKTDKDGDVTENNKKLKKKYMKEGIAMAQSYLSNTLGLDTSIVDVEVVLESSKIVESDGCIVSCFLDAGCDKIVVLSDDVNSSNDTQWQQLTLQALDVSRVPKERLIVQLHDPTIKQQGLAKFLTNAAKYASTITISCQNGQYNSSSTLETACAEWIHFIVPKPADKQAARFTSVVIELALDALASTNTITHTTTSTHTTHTTHTTDKDHIDQLTKFMKYITKLSSDHSTTIQHGIILALTDTTAQQLGHTYASAITTDRPDKLYTTVVCTRSNEALGLVYSSTQSIIAALQCGRGVYYSRSRNGLWRKGDTSGMYQTLHRIDVDCDGDALRFTVTQRGGGLGTQPPAFCHLETLTCWGGPTGIRHLEETLRARMVQAPEGSYTKRLFDDEELLRDKLVEEAQELSEAVDRQHVAEELADVLYFAMVKAAKAGVSIDDAVVELDKRRRKVTRRKGDSKAFRIAAGDAILNNK